MKRLILMRHSYAAADNPAWTDRERPLTDYGRNVAAQTAQLLNDTSIDRILHSSACRTTETAALLAAAQQEQPQLQSLDDLYLAPPNTYRSYIADTDSDTRTLALVGHNPGIGALIGSIAPHGPPVSPGTVAILEYPDHDWPYLVRNGCPPSGVHFIAEGRPFR